MIRNTSTVLHTAYTSPNQNDCGFDVHAQMIKLFRLISIYFIISSSLFAIASRAFAQSEEDKRILLMYYKEDELTVESATRSPKSITQTAENVTVITAEDIKLMNAHTVADVLNTVPGVQVNMTGGPGSIALASIQGSDNRHVTVFLDGIPLNNLSDNVTDLGLLPVQNIKKIEIIKGPASSAWGSALGGVINIITKSGSADKAGGMASVSYGERNTGDFRLETSGKKDRFGYYVDAGRLQTDGFRPHNDFAGNNAYAKLTYDLTRDTNVFFSIGYDNVKRGIADLPDFDLFINNTVETTKSTFAVRSAISSEAELYLSLWQLYNRYDVHNYQSSTGAELSDNIFNDTGYGLSARITWTLEKNMIVIGTDINNKKLESNVITDGMQKLRQSAYYINDTMTIGRLSIIPGVRYDITSTNGDFTNPSLGMTYKLTDTTLVRAYAGHGSNIPPFSATFGDNVFILPNPDLKMEQVWSYQGGVETSALYYLWMKLSAFRHDLKDVIENEPISATQFKVVNGGRERREGLEIELKTLPIFHTFLTAGAVFMTTTDQSTGQTVPNAPQRTYDLGLQYDNKSFKALLQGHYIYWNALPAANGKYNSFNYDLHLTKIFDIHNKQTVETFFDIHNMFDVAQYSMAVFKTPGRWIEAGVRYAF
jgi:vitamin B12 transporter